jgi:hypothetical protein
MKKVLGGGVSVLKEENSESIKSASNTRSGLTPSP